MPSMAGTTTIAVAENKLQLETMRILAHVESIDEALIDEDLGDPYLLFGRWHGNTLMTDRNSVCGFG